MHLHDICLKVTLVGNMTFQTTRFGGSPAIPTSAVLGLQLMILAFQPLLHWSQRGGKLGWYLDILGRTPFKMRLQKSAIENYIHIIFIRVCMYVYIYQVNPLGRLWCLVLNKNVKLGRMLWFMVWFMFGHIHVLPFLSGNLTPFS